MSKLKIGGQVLYQDQATPVANARVQIFDLDEGGNGDDKILETTTNADGKFKGTSKDWEDKNSKRITGPFGPFTMDIPDILGLEFRVSDGHHTHRGPFFHIADNTSIPIVVPWRLPVTVSERELVHLVTLSEQVDPSMKSFYHKFSHNHHPSIAKMFAKYIRRGFSVHGD